MKLVIVLHALFFVGTCQAQIDFNSYTSFQSEGEMPNDFSKPSSVKIDEDMILNTDQIAAPRKKKYYTKINYSIDQLLNSGIVTYGDPISCYVKEVAAKLLFDNTELLDKLRFYTIKSNATNAFSTSQGIIFVTTGLISHIESEAELALVLAHEISHYTESHVRDRYLYLKTNRTTSIQQFSVYSKNHELIADSIGLHLYAKAGYSRGKIMPTLDMLLYSYLNFEQLHINSKYFTEYDSLYFPENIFPNKNYDILDNGDRDDSRGSHPNIDTRKIQLIKIINSVTKWGDDEYKLGIEKFEKISKLARFEYVRNNLHDAEYCEALYSIYVMKTIYNESLFFERANAQAWLGLLQSTFEGNIRSVVDENYQLEGASGVLHEFLGTITNDEIIALSIRNIKSIHDNFINDKEISAIYNRMTRLMAESSDFHLDDYKKISFHSAYLQAQKKQLKLEQKGNTVSFTNEGTVIKTVSAIFPDSTYYHLYLIPDVVTDPNFLTQYHAYKNLLSLTDEEIDSLQNSKTVENLISFKPFAVFEKNGKPNQVSAEKFGSKGNKSIEMAAAASGLKITQFDKQTYISLGTEKYNDYCIMKSYLEQSINNSNNNSFPVDYSLKEELMDRYGTNYIMYSSAYRQYNFRMGLGATALSLIAYPTFPFYLGGLLIAAPKSELNFIIYDTDSDAIVSAKNYQFKSKISKYTFAAYIFDFFKSLE